MWKPKTGEAAEIYATYWTAKHGGGASNAAREIAKSHELNGDLEGRKSWNDVADAIERREQESRRVARQESVIGPN